MQACVVEQRWDKVVSLVCVIMSSTWIFDPRYGYYEVRFGGTAKVLPSYFAVAKIVILLCTQCCAQHVMQGVMPGTYSLSRQHFAACNGNLTQILTTSTEKICFAQSNIRVEQCSTPSDISSVNIDILLAR